MPQISLPEDLAIKIDRAETLVRELDCAVTRFVSEAQTKLVPERADTSNEVEEGYVTWGVRASVPTAVPGEIRALVGDAVANIRAALDYLARSLVISNGGVPQDGGKGSTQFPISYSDAPVRVGGAVDDAALRIIQELQPGMAGKGTRHPLAMLREISNEDKHRAPTVVNAGTSFSTVFLARATGLPRPYGVISPLLRWLKDGDWAVMPIMLFPENAGVEIEANVGTMVSLPGDGPVMPPLATDIDYLLRHVRDAVVPRFEPFFAPPWDRDHFSLRPSPDPIDYFTETAVNLPLILSETKRIHDAFPVGKDGERDVIIMGPVEFVNLDPRLLGYPFDSETT